MKKPVELLDGKVVSSEIKPETVQKSVTKVMKTTMITRTPEGRIATIQLALKGGLVSLEIDEATARAIAKVFD